jgi:glycosyltransferase involved in cell wall biosynthesis
MTHAYRFTVFTASYNRSNTLPRVYESLCAQTFRDFEWLIVDDGSTDGTRCLVESWQHGAKFPIHYVYQENQGKPAAFNRGVREAHGEFFLSIDSDDACVPEALERFKLNWENIPLGRRERFCGVTGLCKYENGRISGRRFPKDIFDSDSIEASFKYKLGGDKWGFLRTDVLKQFPFASGPGSRFVSESTVWFAIARKFKTRFINEPLSIIYPDAAGPEHLSAASASTIAGRAVFHQFVLNELIGWVFRAPRSVLQSAINFSRYSFYLKKGPSEQLRTVNSLTARGLVALSLPLGLLMASRDARRLRRL